MIADLKPYPEYKESGLRWLGLVPEHWEVRQTRHIGRLLKGVGGTKEDAVPEGVPCVRYGELYTTHTYFIRASKACIRADRAASHTPIRHGDVLFAASGETIEEIGKSAVNLMQTAGVCGGDVIVLRPSISVHAPFLGYAMDCRPATNQKSTMGRGTTVKHIYPDELRSLLIPFPTLDEQAAIARFLDWANGRLERAIRAKRKVIALLNEQKQAIIHRAVTRGIDLSIPLKPSGIPWLGDVPEHWEVLPLGRRIRLTTGFPFKSEGFSQSENDIRLLRGINIAPGRVRWGAVVRWPVNQIKDFTEYQLREGDIVLGMDRPIISGGVRIAKIGATDIPSLVLQRVARIRPQANLDTGFATLILGGKSFADYLAPIFTGISVPHVSPEQIRSFRVALPSFEEQLRIVNWVNANTATQYTSIAVALREIEVLREYQTRLITDVVTGKLDVREASAGLPEEAPPNIVEDDTDLIDEIEAAAEEAVL